MATERSVTASAPSIVDVRRNNDEGEEEGDEEERSSRENTSTGPGPGAGAGAGAGAGVGGEERAASTSPQQTATYCLCTSLSSKCVFVAARAECVFATTKHPETRASSLWQGMGRGRQSGQGDGASSSGRMLSKERELDLSVLSQAREWVPAGLNTMAKSSSSKRTLLALGGSIETRWL